MGSPLGPGIVEIVISKVKKEQSIPSVNIRERHQDDVSKSYLLILPYKGKRGGKHFVTLRKKWTGYFPINRKQR